MEYWSLEQAKLNKQTTQVLEGNIVAITGAGGAIGTAIAKEFSSQGAEIVCIDLSKESAIKTAKICGPNASALGWTLQIKSN